MSSSWRVSAWNSWRSDADELELIKRDDSSWMDGTKRASGAACTRDSGVARW